jgi:hypothetical protein
MSSYDYVWTYHCRLTSSLKITVEADYRCEADAIAEDVLKQCEAQGMTMPAFHTFDYVTKVETS